MIKTMTTMMIDIILTVEATDMIMIDMTDTTEIIDLDMKTDLETGDTRPCLEPKLDMFLIWILTNQENVIITRHTEDFFMLSVISLV
mgnify:CR=1 FL=1